MKALRRSIGASRFSYYFPTVFISFLFSLAFIVYLVPSFRVLAMAEILGIVSGTVGVAGFAIEILDSIRKLRVFCSKVKHAHARLEDLLNEVQFLASFITDLGQLDIPFEPRGVAQLASENCRRASEIVAQVLFKVHASLSRNKRSGRWSSLKLVMQENDVQDNLNRLERAKSMLLIAQYSITRCVNLWSDTDDTCAKVA